jgi:hypothetical protein
MNPLSCLVAALGLAHAASALPVNHGTFVGTSVTFQNVTETTQSVGDDECLFTTPDGTANDGMCATAPFVEGDQLIFVPSGFGATATGAGGSGTTHSLLSMVISDTSGDTIRSGKCSPPAPAETRSPSLVSPSSTSRAPMEA